MRHPFIKVISRARDTHTYCRAFSSGAVTTCFYDVGPSRLGFDTQPRLRGQRFNPMRQNYVLMLDHVNIILVSLGVEQVLSVTLNDSLMIEFLSFSVFFRSPESLM